jgi:chaperonin GroES
MPSDKKPIDFLLKNLDSANIADDLDDDLIAEIATKVINGFDIDDESRADWKESTEEGIKIAEQIVEDKTYPWDGASNVKFPLIAISAIQFAARAYPSIINGDKVVKVSVIGSDPQNKKAEKAKRVSAHMSYQLLEQMQGWDEDTDRMLHSLPVVGTMFRKTFYDTLNQQPASELCMPLDVVVHMKTKNLEKCRRITHIIHLYKNDVIERERSGLFRVVKDQEDAGYMLSDEEDAAEEFLEQHRWLDLDNDGYEEPYIVTVHKDSGQLVRIVARYDYDMIYVNDKTGKIRKIEPVHYFTAFFFIPAASGKFYALGFAHLLGAINNSINTTINQLLDAGHLSNVQGGFIGRGLRMRAGQLRFKPGEWKVVDAPGSSIKDNIFPMPVKEPSGVLFNLLGMLNDTGMKLASVSETMAGESPSQNTPATTTLAVIEQGLKVFTAIYKRVFRSLKSEFKKIRRLNSIYLEEEEYFRVLDEENIILKDDYSLTDLDIIPVADPNISSDAQRMARVQAIMATLEQNPTPEGKIEILRQYYEGIQAANIDKLLPEDKIQKMLNAPPPPNPEAIKLELDTVKSQHEEERKRHLLPYDIKKIEAEIDEIKSRTTKNIADAQDKPIQTALATLTAQVSAMHNETKMGIEREKIKQAMEAKDGTGQARNNAGHSPGGNGGMDATPNNQEGPQILPGVTQVSGDGAMSGSNPVIDELGGRGPTDELPSGGDQGGQPYPPDVSRS